MQRSLVAFDHHSCGCHNHRLRIPADDDERAAIDARPPDLRRLIPDQESFAVVCPLALIGVASNPMCVRLPWRGSRPRGAAHTLTRTVVPPPFVAHGSASVPAKVDRAVADQPLRAAADVPPSCDPASGPTSFPDEYDVWRILALRATTTVLSVIRMAPSAGLRMIP